MDVQKNGSLKEVSGKRSHDLSAIWRMCAGRVVMPRGGLGAGWGPPTTGCVGAAMSSSPLATAKPWSGAQILSLLLLSHH